MKPYSVGLRCYAQRVLVRVSVSQCVYLCVSECLCVWLFIEKEGEEKMTAPKAHRHTVHALFHLAVHTVKAALCPDYKHPRGHMLYCFSYLIVWW